MNRRPIAVAMIAVGVLASGCVSRRTYVAKSEQAGALAIALADEQQKTATLSTRAGELEQQLAENRKSLESMTGERDRHVAELEQQRSEQTRQVGDLSGRLADAESRIAALTAERDRLAGERQAQEARAQELAAHLEAARRGLEGTRGEFATARQALEDTRGQLTTAQQELEGTRGRLATTQQELTGAVQERDRLAAERRDLEARTRDLTAELSSAGQQLGETRSQLEAMRQDLARATGERDRVAAERRRLEAEARDLAAQLSATRDQLGAASTELAAARQELDATRQQLETARGELAATQQALAQARGEAASVQQALSGTQGELMSVQQSLGATKEEMAARERKLQEAIAAYDKLVNDLRQEISEGQVQISRLRDKLTVKVLDRILFDSGSARIKPSGQEVLRKVADTVRSLTDQEVHIAGHTDNVPIKESYRDVFPTNWELSTARATGVARFLQEKGSVDPKSLAAVGYGEYRPTQPNDTPDRQAENRRIEIVLVPRDAKTATQ